MPIFKNQILVTKELLDEFSKNVFKIINVKYRVIVFIILTVSSAFTILTLMNDGFSFVSLLLIIFSLFFLFMYTKGYTIKSTKNYENFKKIYGDTPTITSKFYKDKFEVITLDSSMEIEYSEITKVIESDNLYLLMLGRQGLMLDKNNFLMGDFDNFKTFINEKYKR